MSRTKQYSVSPIAAAVSAALVTPAAVLAQEGAVLEEIIVTATKREQNLQKVPASIQALPEAMLKEMGALNTQDYARFMPSVNWISTAAGNNQIIFRGVHTSTGAFTMTRSSSVYLDEIPITSTAGDSPDVRMLDVSRVEALSGPQGTLFGAAAQSGILRIITNQPDTSQFEASADVQFSTGETSDPSHSITGVFNLPLIEDKFAIRIAAQSAVDGGYVDNILGHTPDTWYGETAAESAAAADTCLPFDDPAGKKKRDWGCDRLTWGSHLNDDVVEENWNSAEHTNLRISARWEMTDAVAATLAYHYGRNDSQGNSTYNPFVGDLQTIGFVKNQSESEWEMASLTIEADLGFAQFVSATSFYENQRTYVNDTTLYYHYYMARFYCTDQGVAPSPTYYLWDNPDTGRAIYNPRYCSLFPTTNPTGDVTQLPDIVGAGEGPEWQDRFTQEIRLSAQGETFDWLAGLYYEESNDSWNGVWIKSANVPFQESMAYAAIRDCFEGPSSITNPPDELGDSYRWGCHTGSNAVNNADPAIVAASLITADHLWDSRDDTDWETKAVFGELTW
ncbi:MAG: TonB-dependent receptor, partial [Proteobacteria bacterium]|nr:TonB-dependent receptor [Pseudomonadota bacterium]